MKTYWREIKADFIYGCLPKSALLMKLSNPHFKDIVWWLGHVYNISQSLDVFLACLTSMPWSTSTRLYLFSEYSAAPVIESIAIATATITRGAPKQKKVWHRTSAWLKTNEWQFPINIGNQSVVQTQPFSHIIKFEQVQRFETGCNSTV